MSVNLTPVNEMLERFLEAAALEMGVVLEKNIGQESGGRGEHYWGQPNRSSSPDQYPRKQQGDLVESIYVDQEKPFSYAVGLAADHAFHLEGLKPTGGKKKTMTGNRYPVTRTGEDPRTHDRMTRAAQRSV